MYKRLWAVAYKSLETKEKSSWVIPEVAAVAYESFLLQSSNRVSQTWLWLELVSYGSGRRESFDCEMDNKLFKTIWRKIPPFWFFMAVIRV